MAKSLKYSIKNLIMHSDKRGWLAEMLKRNEIKRDIKQIYVATIKPGAVRGNHYHKKRIEWFLILNGKAKLYLEDLKTKKKVCLTLSSNTPRVVTIFPRVAHALKNISKKTIYLVSAQSDIYSFKNPDTFSYQVL
jgi:dTDP-4-dehydrorhamnose 3,5-epimerase